MTIKRILRIALILMAGLIVACVGNCIYRYENELPGTKPYRINIGATQAQLRAITQALSLYITDCESPPSERMGLNALLINPGLTNWRGPYLIGAHNIFDINDPWGRQFRYRLINSKLEVVSAGPDKKFDTEDDIK
ncbi:MAG: hypothetical protein A2283_01690 [Lentisphaerae bacterium RIFOXYA12_FULL_48_11]|nr:MAG: hypothetical protein A2283_01690 [Lentisphaerae bacterium RIFOXYA12_FULL_48_11]